MIQRKIQLSRAWAVWGPGVQAGAEGTENPPRHRANEVTVLWADKEQAGRSLLTAYKGKTVKKRSGLLLNPERTGNGPSEGR